ncbi:MAG TPA: TRAFs-binding domain-containing protein [Myxococcaceae bacterium]
MATAPFCFVLMPFGRKSDAAGKSIDFDAVYREVIKPAVTEAGLEPFRADEELTGGIIHKAMFERLVLCDYAVADLTLANANVFYELGVRHAARPWSTVSIYAGTSRLPFDVADLRTIHYAIGPDGLPDQVEESREAITRVLRAASRQPTPDSPLFQLLEDYPRVAHEKTDLFRDRVQIAVTQRERLRRARELGKERGPAVGRTAVAQVEAEFADLAGCEAGVLVDLLLSYRALGAWSDMLRLVDAMPRPVGQTVLVQEQYAFALNRLGDGRRAQEVLETVLERRGPSSETLGLLGRVLKDRWERSTREGDEASSALLDEAIEAYRRGFEADFRDAYPGINAVMLMEIRDPGDPEVARMAAVVSYAAERRLAARKPDYWDYATLLEAWVIGQDETRARAIYPKTIAAIRERWEPETTARNLRLIREARERRGAAPDWATQIENGLLRRAQTEQPLSTAALHPGSER